jgi:hypothetical protein
MPMIDAAVVHPIDDHTAQILIPEAHTPRYIVTLTGNQWHIQLAASVATLNPTDTDKAMQIVTDTNNQLAQARLATAAEISSGKLTTAQAVTDALSARVTPIEKARTDTLPPGIVYPPAVQFNHLQGTSPKTDQDFKTQADPAVTHSGLPSLRLTSTTAKPTESTGSLRVINANTHDIDLSKLLGKRIRISAYIKSENVQNNAGMFLIANSSTENQWETFDPGLDRSLTGTTDWKKIDIVFDVYPKTTGIQCGFQLSGAGTVWMDDVRIEIVDDSVPTTDDHNFGLFSQYPSKYTAAIDPKTLHDGHPTLLISADSAPYRSWANYWLNDRHPDKFRGHLAHLTAWVKTENAHGDHLTLWAYDPNGKQRRVDLEQTDPMIKGTTDWTSYTATAEIPADTRLLAAAFTINGNGKAWIDGLTLDVKDPP